MASSERLPWRVRLGYAFGDFGLVLPWQLAGLFLLFFMTEVLGIDPAIAGAVVLVGLVFDACSNIVVGVVADRMRPRLGGYRPWLLLGAPLLGLGTAALFWAPPAQGPALLAAALAIQVAFRLCFALVSIPFVSLSSSLTTDSRERSLLVGARMTFATLATLTIATGFRPLADGLGEGDLRQGFLLAAGATGLASGLIVLLAWLATRGWEMRGDAAPKPATLAEIGPAVLRNDAYLRVIGCTICYAASQSVVLTGAPFFFEFARGEPQAMGPTLAILIGSVALFTPLCTIFARRAGKRVTWLAGGTWSVAALVGLAVLSGAPLPVLLTAMAAAGIGFAAVGFLPFAMLPDTVEYGQWRTDVRAEAILTAGLTFAQKVAVGLATWIVGLLLAAIGHDAETPMSGEGAALFGVLLFAAPAVLMSISLLIVRGYPLSTAAHARIVAELAARAASEGRPT